MARREGSDIWRDSPEDTQDRRGMGDWEKACYDYAETTALSRAKLLKLAGVGLGGVLLGPVANAGARVSSETAPLAGNIVMSRSGVGRNLDPHTGADVRDAEIMAYIYDSLVYVDARGKVLPGLATAWSFNQKGTVLKFKLRQGVTFHDGTPFDANDVRYALNRWRDPKTASATAAGFLGPISDVAVVDKFTVAVSFSQPFAPVFVNLSAPFGGMISQAAVAKYGAQFGRNPVGTGPYQFVEWNAEDTIKLRRNPNHRWSTPFYLAPNGKPLTRGPVLDSVDIRTIPVDATRYAAFTGKEVDLLLGYGGVPNQQVATLKKNKSVQVQQVPAGLLFMVLNTIKAPLKDPRVRQALSYGIDRKRLVALAWSGQAKPGTNLLYSGFAQYDPSVAKKYNYHDPEKAKALLKAAGQSKGLSFNYVLASDYHSESDKRAAQLIQQDMSKIGVKMNLKLVPVTVYIKEYLDPDVLKRDNAYLNGYLNPQDPAGAISVAWGKNGFSRFGFKDGLFDTLMDQQALALNPKKRTALWHRLQQRLSSMQYAIPLYEQISTVAAHNYVRNLHLDWQGYIHPQELTRS